MRELGETPKENCTLNDQKFGVVKAKHFPSKVAKLQIIW